MKLRRSLVFLLVALFAGMVVFGFPQAAFAQPEDGGGEEEESEEEVQAKPNPLDKSSRTGMLGTSLPAGRSGAGLAGKTALGTSSLGSQSVGLNPGEGPGGDEVKYDGVDGESRGLKPKAEINSNGIASNGIASNGIASNGIASNGMVSQAGGEVAVEDSNGPGGSVKLKPRYGQQGTTQSNIGYGSTSWDPTDFGRGRTQSKVGWDPGEIGY